MQVLPDFTAGAKESIESAVHYMKTRQAPYALLVKKQTFEPYKMQGNPLTEEPGCDMTREEAIQAIMGAFPFLHPSLLPY